MSYIWKRRLVSDVSKSRVFLALTKTLLYYALLKRTWGHLGFRELHIFRFINVFFFVSYIEKVCSLSPLSFKLFSSRLLRFYSLVRQLFMDDSLTQLRRLDRFKSAFVSNVRNWIKKKSRGSTSSAKQLGEVRTEPVAQPQKSRHCQRSHLLFLHPFRPFESRGDPLCTILDNPHNYTQKLGQKSIIFQTLTPLTVSEDWRPWEAKR